MDAICGYKIKRRNAWTPEAEEVLFKVWSGNLSKLRVSKMNPKDFEEMSHKMDADGFTYTAKQVKTKIHNLVSKYRDERRLWLTCGIRPTWSLYQTVHNIYGKYKNFHLEPESEGCGADDNSLDPNVSAPSEGIDVDYSSDDFNEDSTNEAAVTCMETVNRNMLSLIKHTHEQNQKSLDLQREMLAIQKERNDILVKMLDVFKNKWKNKTAIEENNAAKRIKLSDTYNDVKEAEAQNGNGSSNAVQVFSPQNDDNETSTTTSDTTVIASQISNVEFYL